MTTALRRPMSLEAFLAREERQEGRWEFDGFAPVAMVGVTRAHAEIQANLTVALRTRLRGSPCRFYGTDLKLRTVETIRYPDGFVTCTPGTPTQTVVDDPVVIFEILSPGTEHIDHGDKARE